MYRLQKTSILTDKPLLIQRPSINFFMFQEKGMGIRKREGQDRARFEIKDCAQYRAHQ